MKEDERIEEALGRFSRIFNGLNMLGKKYPEREIITKVLRSLNKCLSKFNESSRNLDIMLKNQKHVYGKKGVCFDSNKASTSENERRKVKKPIRQPQANKANK
ncbi:hypothetical protein PIB30_111891, partial [Stylosanthes scabra]|nr:hypothetical protein [Stylosanthes scabra]